MPKHARISEERVPVYGSNGVIGFYEKAIKKDEQQLLEDFPVGRMNLRRLTGNNWTPELHAVKKAEPVPVKNEVFRLVDPAGNFCEHPYRTEHP